MSRFGMHLVMLVSVALAFGCHLAGRHSVFDVIAVNTGNVKLQQVAIVFPGLSHPVGVLGPGHSARYSLFEGRFPESARVSWRLPDERPYMPDHFSEVSIPRDLPVVNGKDRCELWFSLDGESVTARVEVASTR